MKLKPRDSARRLRICVYRATTRAKDRLGPYAEATLVMLLGLAFVAIVRAAGLCDLSECASIAGAFAATAVLTYFLRRGARQQAALIEVTMSYLLHGGKPLLDDLLGKLIGRGWRSEGIVPGEALFDVLEEICSGHDWEMKRRVAEAIAALGEIDGRRAIQVAKLLREDWEPVRWESDLRRRVVEELAIPIRGGGLSLLDRTRPDDCTGLLRLRERDQIYVAMAIAEVLHKWENSQARRVAQLRVDLLGYAEKAYPQDQNEALLELLELLRVSSADNAWVVLKRFEQMLSSQNVFVRIAASRNVLLLSERFPGRILEFMLSFLGESQPKNVRRPVAREQSMEFLIDRVGSREHRAKAEEVLWKLFADSDDIIRVTAFDKAESLKRKDRTLVLRVCDFILEKETSPVLLERAQRVRQELTSKG